MNKYEIETIDVELSCGCCIEERYILLENSKRVYSSTDYEDCLIYIINRENINFVK